MEAENEPTRLLAEQPLQSLTGNHDCHPHVPQVSEGNPAWSSPQLTDVATEAERKGRGLSSPPIAYSSGWARSLGLSLAVPYFPLIVGR